MTASIAARDHDLDPARAIGRWFCLIGETAAGGDGPQPVMIPAGRSSLVILDGDAARVVASPETASFASFLVEPIRRTHGFQLLVAAVPGEPVLVNGAPAPPLAVLEERDVITIDDGRVNLHVSTFVRPYHGTALPEHEGRSCSFCQTPITGGRDVYACPFCDAPAHLDTHEDTQADAEGDADLERDAPPHLECAAHMQSCSQCLNPVLSGEGLTSIPEEALGA